MVTAAAPLPPPLAYCPARVRLTTRIGEPTAPCMLPAGHPGACDPATNVVENHAPKRAVKK